MSMIAVNEPNSTLGVTGDIVGGSTLVVTGGVVDDGGSVTTVVLFTIDVVDASSGGFVPTTRQMPAVRLYTQNRKYTSRWCYNILYCIKNILNVMLTC